MTAFLAPLAGGALIGASAALLLLANGRIAGISGILGGLLDSLFDRLFDSPWGRRPATGPGARPSSSGSSPVPPCTGWRRATGRMSARARRGRC